MKGGCLRVGKAVEKVREQRRGVVTPPSQGPGTKWYSRAAVSQGAGFADGLQNMQL